jgi:hypothetical protein
MAAPRGRRSTARRGGDPGREATPPTADSAGLLRRALGLGIASFFSGEEILRKTLGDTVPREWVEFAAAQSERTRRDFAERLAAELGKRLDALDLERLATRLLQGHTVEVNASIRFRPPAEDRADAGHSVRVRVAREEKS